jgi:hypothetical protein
MLSAVVLAGNGQDALLSTCYMTTRFEQTGRQKAIAAFTLVEAMIASGIMVLVVAACLSSIVFNQVSVRKAKEEAIAMDFLTYYAEDIKALPFAEVVAGNPINSLFNGKDGAQLITIPPNGSWVPLNTTAFQTFDTDLVWLNNRNPSNQVTLTPNYVGGVLHDIEVNAKIDWDAPLTVGGRLEVQVDFLRTKDTSPL